MKARYYLYILLSVLGILLILFLRYGGVWLVREDVPAQADAMVLLMGSIPDRALQTADLYAQGISGKVLIVEEHMGGLEQLKARGVRITTRSAQVKGILTDLGVEEEDIRILPGAARSTLMEAEAVRDYLSTREDIRSVLIVSASEHCRRAYLIFRSAFKSLPQEVDLYTSPSSYTPFQAQGWWKRKEDIQRVLGEQIKIIHFYLSDRRRLRKS